MTYELDTLAGSEQAKSLEDSLSGIASVLDEVRLADEVGVTAGTPSGLAEVPVNVRLSVVIPIYNERNTLDEILRRVEAVPIEKEIILIDDASNDGTRDMVRAHEGRPGFQILYHDRNRGKGAAIRAGFAHATGDIVLVQDADLEYDPRDYLALIQPIVDGRAEVVFGSRYLTAGVRRAPSYWHTLGNRMLTGLSNMVTNLCLTDMETCYKVFKREALDAIAANLKEDRFGIEVEITAKIARKKFRVYEVPVGYAGRTSSEGKKIGWRDAVAAVRCIARYSHWD